MQSLTCMQTTVNKIIMFTDYYTEEREEIIDKGFNRPLSPQRNTEILANDNHLEGKLQ